MVGGAGNSDGDDGSEVSGDGGGVGQGSSGSNGFGDGNGGRVVGTFVVTE